MSEIQIIISMNQSLMNKIKEFKNKEIKKDDLNKFMLLNLCHVLKTTNKFKSRNEKIQKKQNIEIKKALTKIKSYQGEINFNSKELEANPVMNKLNNPTLESYIPVSQISYSTEIQFYKKNSDKCDFNESLLFEKNEERELVSKEKEIDYEETPITFSKNSNNNFKQVKKGDIVKNTEDELIDLINKDDEDLFINEVNEKEKKNLLFYELTNSFDEKKEYGNEDFEIDFKKRESLFYLDDIFTNQKFSKRNSSEIYSNNFSSFSGSTSIDSRNISRGESKDLINKEIYETEFAKYMSFEFFKKYCKKMNIYYLRYMLVIYSKIVNTSKNYFIFEEKMFINVMKSFILKIGISYKKYYDKIIQKLLTNKKNVTEFEKFVKSFSTILKLNIKKSIIKYRFIISLFRLGEEDINFKHINIFFQLIRGKMIYNSDLYDELNNNLIKKYDRVYSNEIGTNFKFGNILIILESLLDKKGYK